MAEQVEVPVEVRGVEQVEVRGVASAALGSSDKHPLVEVQFLSATMLAVVALESWSDVQTKIVNQSGL